MLKHVLEQQFMEKKNNLVSILQLSVLVFRNYRVNILMMYPIAYGISCTERVSPHLAKFSPLNDVMRAYAYVRVRTEGV